VNILIIRRGGILLHMAKGDTMISEREAGLQLLDASATAVTTVPSNWRPKQRSEVSDHIQ
jgi:hypothetical protein